MHKASDNAYICDGKSLASKTSPFAMPNGNLAKLPSKLSELLSY